MKEYSAKDITVLEGLKAVRKRPGMYIGSTGINGLHHLIYEVVDNSVDEALAGFCNSIEIILQKDHAVRVIDNGRGIPVEYHEHEKQSALHVVMTKLHAGGKFNNNSYSISGGLHGVGISVVNALSSKMNTEVKRNGFVWKQSFVNGGKIFGKLKKGDATNKTGTIQTFYPDKTIFETINYDFNILKSRFQQIAFLNKNLKISFFDKRNISLNNQKYIIYKYKNGLIDYINYINKLKKIDNLHENIIFFKEKHERNSLTIEAALQWTNSYRENLFTYANIINTREGGTHEEGFKSAITSVINKYARKKGILKEKDENLSGDDIREGLTAILSIKLTNPQFEGQTKTKLGNPEIRSLIQQSTSNFISDWLDKNPISAKNIVKKSIKAFCARLAAKQARDNSRKKDILESASVPGKLKECQSKDPDLSEIYIVEGDSAGGSAVRGRDPIHQAILPLRGKILNVERASLDKVLSNIEIQAMITSFKTGIMDNFQIEKLRYKKIIIMADADIDGQHINTLLLTLFFRYMKPLIESGFIYIAQPPLYRIKWVNRNCEYAYNDEEKDHIIAKGLAKNMRLPKYSGIQRYKGLGEMNYAELWDTTMNPKKRSLLQVKIEDAVLCDQMFSILMGNDVQSRKQFIQQNSVNIDFSSM